MLYDIYNSSLNILYTKNKKIKYRLRRKLFLLPDAFLYIIFCRIFGFNTHKLRKKTLLLIF